MTPDLCGGCQCRKPQGAGSGAHPEFHVVLKSELWVSQRAGGEGGAVKEAAGRRKQCPAATERHGRGA